MDLDSGEYDRRKVVLLIALKIVLGVLVALVLLFAIFVWANWAPDRPVSALQERWAPPPSQFIEVMGMQVHVRDEGPRDDPSPVVLMHGTGSSLHDWEGWAAALRDKRRVITFDLPGFGLTGPSPDSDYSLEHMTRFLLALLDKLGVKRCVLGGNSLGGAISWRTALLEPSRVDKLILVDVRAYPARPNSVPLGFRLARIPGINWLLVNTLPRSLVAQGMRNTAGDPSFVTPERIDRHYDLMLREGNRRAFLERARRRDPSSPLVARIPELKLPTLIMWGGRDRLIPPENAERLHRDIAGSKLVIFDDLGHAPEDEDPGRTVKPVKEFLGIE
ncbi:MAG TPA: alpha/beta hydrolase [Xanthobacteraceae bacterium]|nr:alpha/beta hydrolase [Xanthobacteraceae bacterium]